MLVTKEGKEIGDKLSGEFLGEALQSVPSATSAAALSKLRPILDSLFPELDERALATTQERSSAALKAAELFFESETSRLSHLQSINPAITSHDIDEITAQRAACSQALQQAKPIMEGLRVCVAL